MFLILFLYTIFTINMFIEASVMSSNSYPFFVAGMRIGCAGLLLLAMYSLQEKSFEMKKFKELFSYAVMKYIMVLYVISVSASAWSMQYVSPDKACFIFVLSPFITALMLYFWYKEHLSYKKIAGLLIGFLAVLPIIFTSNQTQGVQVNWYIAMLAYGIFTLGVICFAYGWILHKHIKKYVTIAPSMLTALSLIIGGLIQLCLAFIVYLYNHKGLELSSCFWWKIGLFSIVSAASYYLYGLALQRYSITFVSFASFTQPAFGLLFAMLLLGKSITVTSVIALCILSFAFYLFYQEELTHALH